MAMDYKAELLGAVAAGGSRAKAAYEKTRASMAQGQADATRMALSNSVANNVPDEARAVVGGIIGQPYANHDAALQAQQASSEDYFSRMGANAGTYMDQAAALVPALERRNALKLEYEKAIREWEMMMGAQGGGGSGSGKGGETDWFDPYKDEFDTKANLYNYITQEAGRNPRVPASVAARAIAAEFGLPQGVADSRWADSTYLTEGLAALDVARKKKLPVHVVRKVAMKKAASTKGNQAAERRYLLDLYRGGPPKKKKKKK